MMFNQNKITSLSTKYKNCMYFKERFLSYFETRRKANYKRKLRKLSI